MSLCRSVQPRFKHSHITGIVVQHCSFRPLSRRRRLATYILTWSLDGGGGTLVSTRPGLFINKSVPSGRQIHTRIRGARPALVSSNNNNSVVVLWRAWSLPPPPRNTSSRFMCRNVLLYMTRRSSLQQTRSYHLCSTLNISYGKRYQRPTWRKTNLRCLHWPTARALARAVLMKRIEIISKDKPIAIKNKTNENTRD